jgi:hypothetical protein
MTIVLIPDFGGQLIQRLAGYVSAICLDPVDPNRKFVSLILREG